MQSAVLQERLQIIDDTMKEAAGTRFPLPKVIAVTKTHSVDAILPLKDLGITAIGENRVQEILQKYSDLVNYFDIHLIGRLQTNKVKYIIDKVTMIQSVDRVPLADEINRQAAKKNIVMPVLIQVNPAGEEQKGGIAPDEVVQFIKYCAHLPNIKVCGLMAVMPNTEDRAYLKSLFNNMRQLFDFVKQQNIQGTEIKELSMGMSHDYDLAAACGATMVRVGSSLFGPRGLKISEENG